MPEEMHGEGAVRASWRIQRQGRVKRENKWGLWSRTPLTILPLPQSARAGALSLTAKPLLQSEWRLNIPWNQSSLAFWMHSQSPWTFHMQMWVLFISFVALVGQWCHAEGRWIKLVNLKLFSAYLRPPLPFLPLFIAISSSQAATLPSPAGV